MPEEEGKVKEGVPGIILMEMETLEEGIRRLHDNLTPLMVEPIPKDDVKDENPCSPMSASLKLMKQLIADINKRLEL